MKKTFVVLLITFILIPVFSAQFDVQVNAGYGFLEGKRSSCPEKDMNNLKATGIEAGCMLSYLPSEKWGIEAYFDYLFADKGSFAKKNAGNPSDIPSNMKYTDYKAGLGLQRRFYLSEKNYVKLGCGFNFTGISNHTYSKNPKVIENQIEGNKVTSFGFYANLSLVHKLSGKLAVSAGVHGCLNPFGFIRNLNVEKHEWVNYFDTPVKVFCYSTFAQLGLIYSF